MLLKLTASSNRDAIGARVKYVAARDQWREVRGGGGYLSPNDFRVHFGLARPVSIGSGRWPNGGGRWTDRRRHHPPSRRAAAMRSTPGDRLAMCHKWLASAFCLFPSAAAFSLLPSAQAPPRHRLTPSPRCALEARADRAGTPGLIARRGRRHNNDPASWKPTSPTITPTVGRRSRRWRPCHACRASPRAARSGAVLGLSHYLAGHLAEAVPSSKRPSRGPRRHQARPRSAPPRPDPARKARGVRPPSASRIGGGAYSAQMIRFELKGLRPVRRRSTGAAPAGHYCWADRVSLAWTKAWR